VCTVLYCNVLRDVVVAGVGCVLYCTVLCCVMWWWLVSGVYCTVLRDVVVAGVV
jgi:hypothetical protein